MVTLTCLAAPTVALLAAAALAAAPTPADAAHHHPHHHQAKNARFTGTWTPNTGVAWTVTSENRKTGTCTGVSALADSGYGFTDCQVTGQKYTFVVTYGSSYRSVNKGTIKGNTLRGSFNDGSGKNPYTATRS